VTSQAWAIVSVASILAVVGIAFLWRRMPVYRWYCRRCKKVVSSGRFHPGRCACGTNVLLAYRCRSCASWNTSPLERSSWQCDDCSSKNISLGFEYHLATALWRRRDQDA
jgi:hypothetical protein